MKSGPGDHAQLSSHAFGFPVNASCTLMSGGVFFVWLSTERGKKKIVLVMEGKLSVPHGDQGQNSPGKI